jgi:hypothetical protein
MSLIELPEGVEVDLRVYLVGSVDGEDVEVALTVGGLPRLSDQMLPCVAVDTIIKAYDLDDLGAGWRVMTRAEIADYKRRKASE